MSEIKPKYKAENEIYSFLGFEFMFNYKKEFPFNRDPKDVIFYTGQVLIPREGIDVMVQNKISDKKEMPISEIKIMCQIPFTVNGKDGTQSCGIVNHDISLTFRYDKEFKYGNITKSIYEVCYYIMQNGIRTNNFYIIDYGAFNDFFSYYVIPNQWALGSTVPLSGGLRNRFHGDKPNANDRFPKLTKCLYCEYMFDADVDNGKCPICDTRISDTNDDDDWDEEAEAIRSEQEAIEDWKWDFSEEEAIAEAEWDFAAEYGCGGNTDEEC